MTALPPDVVTDLERENARLQAELRAAGDRQAASAEILRTIGSVSGNAERSLHEITETTKRLFEASSVSIFVANGDEWGQVIHAGAGAKRIGAEVPVSQLRIGGHSLPGAVFSENRQIHLPDINNVDPAIADWPGLPPARAAGTRTISGTPLRRAGQAIGVLTVHRDRLAPFTDEELALLQTFADQAAIAIENARLINETLERQTATSEILRVINNSGGDLAPVFDCILEHAHHLCGAPCGSLQLYERDRVVPVAIRGMTPAFAEFLRGGYPITEGIRESLFDHPVQRLDMAEFLRSHPGEPSLRAAVELGGIGTMVTVPLTKNGVTFGRIVAARQEVRSFTDKQIALLQGFAEQAVVAIENARLFNETQEALARQTATSDILRVISQSPTDVRPVFDAIVLTAVRLLRCDMAFFLRCHGSTFSQAALVESGGSRPVLDLAPVPIDPDANFPSRAIVSKKNLHLPDWSTIDLPDHERHIRETYGINSSLFVPLLRAGECVGLLAMAGKQANMFGEAEIALAESFRDQALIAIENTRLFNETKDALERQTATADILKVIASSPSDVQPVFEAIATSANRLIGGFSSTVFRLVDGVAFLKAFTPTTPAADEVLQATFPRPAADFPPFRMAQAGEVTQIPDTEVLSDEILNISRARGFRSMLFAPLMNDGVSIGFIAVTRVQPGAFADHHVQLLRTFADQAVIAIENVRLFDEVQARTRELSQSLDDLRTAQDRLVQTEKLASLGQLTAGIAHEIKNPLNFVNNFAALSAELTDELNEVLKPATLAGNIREEVDELTGLLKDNLQKVVQHGKRADSIVKNMLLHSRDGSGEHRPADINALLDESLNLAYHGARAEKPQFNVTLRRDFDDMAGLVELFPQEITRVFLNLISNGFYAVTKRKAEDDGTGFEPVLHAATRDLGDTVEIRIRDNGTGIPAEVKEKMFNPFFTTKPAGEGTGLGLSMSHDIIVKQHGGRIDVETAPGQFTEFRIVLPRTSGIKQG
jgi:two-component system NtrC family sensor kinase